MLATSPLRIQTTTVSAVLRTLAMQPLNSKQLCQARLVETFVEKKHRVFTRFQTSSARSTPRHTTLKSRLMFSAVGYTSRIQVYVLSTMAKLASLKCRCLTTQTLFVWARVSTPPSCSLKFQVPSAEFAKMLPCQRTTQLRESEQFELHLPTSFNEV